MNVDLPSLYLASPLFSEAEKAFNRGIRDNLRSLAKVYLPQEDGQLLVELVTLGLDAEEAKQRIYNNDVSAIAACDIVLLVMDGRCIDEGAAFELGFARAIGKTCIGLKTDPRSLLPFGDNPMIECALDARFNDLTTMRDWIQDWIAGSRPDARRREIRALRQEAVMDLSARRAK